MGLDPLTVNTRVHRETAKNYTHEDFLGVQPGHIGLQMELDVKK